MRDTTAQAFLEAILDQPEDTTLRLVYSDWLEEHGQERRAELIRVQCELAGLPRWHPARLALTLRERTLLDRYARDWRAELPVLPGVKWGRLERGFVTSVHVADFDVLAKHADDIWNAAPIDAVAVGADEYGDNHLFGKNVPVFPRLRRLHVIESNYEREQFKRFADSPILSTLHTLRFSGYGMENNGVEVLMRSPHLANLRELNLRGSYVGSGGMAFIAGAISMHGLSRLCLAGNGYGSYTEDPIITTDGVRTLAAAPNLTSLTALDLTGNQMDDSAVERLLSSPYLRNLKELKLSENRLSAESMQAFGRLQDGPQLESIDLRQNAIGNRGLQALASSPLTRGLKNLQIGTCELGSEAGKILAHAHFRCSLCELEMSNNNLAAAGCADLLAVPWPKLDTLGLGYNDIGAEGAKWLAESKSLPVLVDLNLSRNGLDLPGAKALSTSTTLGNLRQLILSENHLDAGAFMTLFSGSTFPRLMGLDVSKNQPGVEGIRALASSLMPELCALVLGQAGVTDNPLKLLFQSANWPNLCRLYLNENKLTGKSVEELARSAFAGGITYLDLSKNKIGDEGAVALAGHSFERLSRLFLSQNDIQRRGLTALAETKHLPALTSLHVWGNAPVQDLMRELQNRYNRGYTEHGFLNSEF